MCILRKQELPHGRSSAAPVAHCAWSRWKFLEPAVLVGPRHVRACSWFREHGTPAASASAGYPAAGMLANAPSPAPPRAMASARPAMVGVANSCAVAAAQRSASRTRIMIRFACRRVQHGSIGK